ncbi:MAG: metal-dependent hydrolase [Kofleriaceae bacterium]
MRSLSLFAGLALALGLSAVAHAQPRTGAPPPPPPHTKPAVPAGKTSLTWYGHAAFRIDLPSGKVVLIDPWLTNPVNPAGKELVKTVPADLLLVTHGHSDHVGDSVAIAKRTKAKLVATYDLGNAMVSAAGFPKAQYGMETGGNTGGTLQLLDGELSITFVPAVHSSDIANGAKITAGGNPGGFVIVVKNGPTLYHTGDTDLFGDMALIPKFSKIDWMLACIGGHFTMDPVRAAEAVRLVNPRQVVPMHFGTFPALKGTPSELDSALGRARSATKMVEMKVGEPVSL